MGRSAILFQPDSLARMDFPSLPLVQMQMLLTILSILPQRNIKKMREREREVEREREREEEGKRDRKRERKDTRRG